ncbi:MAG: group II intron reverse transcriptase/maturase [Bacteroidetes bacterium]|nr:MAG: group II intron reverse transcriptase/maturase [Bacteroidota bacterium]
MRSILLNIRLNTRSDNFHWHDVNWHKVVNNVRKLQCRIAKAVKLKKPQRVIKGLMRLLNKSLSARLLAVKKVVSNKGKNTTGIDGVKLNTPEKKIAAVQWLKNNNNQNYKAKALKRVFIPKKQKNKKRQKISLKNLLRRMNVSKDWRPLGIPTLHDRCLQALHKSSLEPFSETTADLNSYAYRPLRSVKDAIQQVFAVTGYKNSATCILEGDITGCFDNISHKWTLENIPLNKHILKEWLKSGYVYENHLFKSESGTPQGGIISPLIANMVLDGLEEKIKALKLSKCNFVRYADDFIVTGVNEEVLETEIKPLIIDFLSQRGLELSKAKTKITDIDKGFDFLGFNIRKYNGKPLIKPSEKSISNLKYKIKTVFKKLVSTSTVELLETLNPILRGWANNYDSQVSKNIFESIDNYVWQKSVNYMKYRHNRGRSKHFYKKYFTKSNKHKVDVLKAEKKRKGQKTILLKMFRLGEVKITRHIKVRSSANVFDKDDELYFEKRELEKWKRNTIFAGKQKRLRLRQLSKCPHCGHLIYLNDAVEIHHKIFKAEGGSNKLENLQLLHENCHRQLHYLQN